MAVKVTLVPWQIGPGVEEDMFTVGVTTGSTCTETGLLEIVVVLAHPSIPLNVQLTCVPLAKELEIKVLELVPTGLPPAIQP